MRVDRSLKAVDNDYNSVRMSISPAEIDEITVRQFQPLMLQAQSVLFLEQIWPQGLCVRISQPPRGFKCRDMIHGYIKNPAIALLRRTTQ